MSLFVNTLIVAGGGGGGGGGNGGTTSDQNGGGGGGGGVVVEAVIVAAGDYDIVVGEGGVQSVDVDEDGGDGGDSSAIGLTATGGGGGGSGKGEEANHASNGHDGGSGGGGAGNEGAGGDGGNGITEQGYDGGDGDSITNKGYGAGGGGASEAGGNPTSSNGGKGGDGVASSISGAPVTYGGGGGGQQANGGTNLGGAGGTGGGGHGGGSNRSTEYPGVGTDGLGGGGGGGNRGGSSSTNYAVTGGSGRGGKGIVIISYITANFGICTGGSKTVVGPNTIHTFTSSGTFTIETLPEVQTFTVTDVTKTTGTANGDLVSDGGETIIEMGFVYNTSPNPTVSDTKITVDPVNGPYTSPITGLTENTQYYIKSFVILASGTYYGNQITFTTLPPVTISTFAITEITQTTALANGEITDDGGDEITERGFVWAITINPDTGDDKVIVAGTLGEYSGVMDSLTADTLYYVRAYAITDAGISYGENRTFRTASTLARVGALDTGLTDYGDPIYFEMIDRWRSFTDMYAKSKSISGINFYTENAAGVRTYFQSQKTQVNVWEDLGTITEANNALFPNASTKDFDVGRIRIAGFTKGTQIVMHSIEILSINDKGFDQN